MWRSVNMRRPRKLAAVPPQSHQTGGESPQAQEVVVVPHKLRQLCGVAVARSRCQLVDINVEYFGNTPLLKHIVNSSSQLKRLRLVSCYDISDKGLSEAAPKLPLLEELDISYCSFSKEPLEAVGRSCPLLRTLKFNGYGLKPYFEYNGEAFAIAQDMPELRHLQLVEKNMTDDGLQAILDSCPHLESLDIRQCYRVTLAGNLAKICAERIKDFRGPLDSIDDYEYHEFLIDRNERYYEDDEVICSKDVDSDFYNSD